MGRVPLLGSYAQSDSPKIKSVFGRYQDQLFGGLEETGEEDF